MKTEYQVSDHGCGRKSVQVFRDGKTIADHDIVRDVNGWKVVAAGVATNQQPATIPTWEECINAMRDDFAHDRKRLQEIGQYQFDQMLGAVPPARHKQGCYVCGEAYAWTADGEVYYCGFDLGDGRYGMALMTMLEFEKEILTGRLKANLLSGAL